MKDDKSNVANESKDSKAVTKGSKKTTAKSKLVVSKSGQEPEFIKELEDQLNEQELILSDQLTQVQAQAKTQTAKIEQQTEGEASKLESQLAELKSFRQLLNYFNGASQAFHLLQDENSSVRMSITVTNADRVEKLTSTKVETATEVLSLFKTNAETRIKEVLSDPEKQLPQNSEKSD